MTADVDMDDENLRPVVPDGTHLVWSKSTEGRKRALLFDDETGALIGPAELEYVEDDHSDSTERKRHGPSGHGACRPSLTP